MMKEILTLFIVAIQAISLSVQLKPPGSFEAFNKTSKISSRNHFSCSPLICPNVLRFMYFIVYFWLLLFLIMVSPLPCTAFQTRVLPITFTATHWNLWTMAGFICTVVEGLRKHTEETYVRQYELTDVRKLFHTHSSPVKKHKLTCHCTRVWCQTRYDASGLRSGLLVSFS